MLNRFAVAFATLVGVSDLVGPGKTWRSIPGLDSPVRFALGLCRCLPLTSTPSVAFENCWSEYKNRLLPLETALGAIPVMLLRFLVTRGETDPFLLSFEPLALCCC